MAYRDCEEEDSWLTLGLDVSVRLIVVVHAFEELDTSRCRVRLISARKATKKEERQYGTTKR